MNGLENLTGLFPTLPVYAPRNVSAGSGRLSNKHRKVIRGPEVCDPVGSGPVVMSGDYLVGGPLAQAGENPAKKHASEVLRPSNKHSCGTMKGTQRYARSAIPNHFQEPAKNIKSLPTILRMMIRGGVEEATLCRQ